MSEREGIDPDTGIPWIIDDTGEKRYLACFNSPETIDDKYAAGVEELPDSEIKEVDYSFADPRILNQKRTSGCVGWSAAKLLRLMLALRGAMPVPNISPAFIYALINGGRDAGANLYQSFKVLVEIGAALEEVVPDNQIFRRMIAESAFEQAKRFKLSKGTRVQTFRQIISQLTIGNLCSGGIMVDQNFMNFANDNGVIRRGGRRVGGHAITFVGTKKFNGKWKVKFVNSWAESYGLRGYGYLGEEWFDGERDHWAGEVTSIDPQDPNMPPVPHE